MDFHELQGVFAGFPLEVYDGLCDSLRRCLHHYLFLSMFAVASPYSRLWTATGTPDTFIFLCAHWVVISHVTPLPSYCAATR